MSGRTLLRGLQHCLSCLLRRGRGERERRPADAEARHRRLHLRAAPRRRSALRANGVGNTDAAISPDGKNVYTVSFNYDGNPVKGTLAILDRDPDTGVLTQKPGRQDASATPERSTGARPSTGSLKPSGIAVSPDGKSVYAGDFDTNTLWEFNRDTTTGELTPGECFHDSRRPCADTHGMGTARPHRRQPEQSERLRRGQQLRQFGLGLRPRSGLRRHRAEAPARRLHREQRSERTASTAGCYPPGRHRDRPRRDERLRHRAETPTASWSSIAISAPAS